MTSPALTLDLDELEPSSDRPTQRPSHIVPVHVGDCEKTAVFPEIESLDGTATFVCPCTVSHVGERVVHVSFHEGWHRIVTAMGLDPHDTHTEGYLWTLAARAFQRWGRR